MLVILTLKCSRLVTSTRSKVLMGLLAGVDITAPTAEFAISGLDEDAREIDDEFEVIVEDNSGGSGTKQKIRWDFVNTPWLPHLRFVIRRRQNASWRARCRPV